MDARVNVALYTQQCKSTYDTSVYILYFVYTLDSRSRSGKHSL